jgi:type 1 glutamine amidotransferase
VRSTIAWFLLAAMAWVGTASGGEAKQEEKIKVLIVTGGHGFNRDAFFKMFQDNPAITFTEAKQGKTSVAYDRDDLLDYDVVVLYDLVQGITEEQKAKFLSLFEKGVGLVALHHCLASYQDWPAFEQAVGGKFFLRPETRNGVTTPKSGTGGGKLAAHVVSKDHPVTAGMSDYELQDEYYNRCRVAEGVALLVTTENPGNQREVAWCREQGKSRVVYIMSGHDQKVYNHPSYRQLLANAIRWAARK